MPTITLPGGYAPEEGKGPGDVVTALVSIRLGSDGTTAEIVDIDGAKFSEEPEKNEESVVEDEVVNEGDESDSSSDAFGSRLDQAVASMRGGNMPMM